MSDAGLLLFAWFLGALVGAQREAQGRAAGLRTHVLVCSAACLLTLVSRDPANGDRGRIAAQIVSGVGFLGAGVILRKGVSVRGLTTAATIWTVAALGIAVGMGGRFALLAAFATFLVLITLTLVRHIEDRLQKSAPREAVLSVVVSRKRGRVGLVLQTLTDAGAIVTSFETEDVEPEEGRLSPTAIINEASPSAPVPKNERLLRIALRLDSGVRQADVASALTEALPGTVFEWET